MAEQKLTRKLTFKLMLGLLLAAVAAGLLFLLCRLGGQSLIQQVYMAPSRCQARAQAEITDFRHFVSQNRIASTDAQSVGRWSMNHDHVRLTIMGKDAIITADSYGAELNLSNFGISLHLRPQTVYDFPVNFSDGSFTVSVYDYSEQQLYTVVDLIALTVAAGAFLLFMLLYNRHITRSVLSLSRQVRQVSHGDLQMHIQPPSNDEIGQLAEDVETMRLSIIDKLRREEAAWQANSQLITAISHDVRTPLTALMGYLDVLQLDGLTPEDRKTYLEICTHNAARLKELTDELFAFFLLFGQATPDQTLEDFDAATLMEQILLEAQVELQQAGFEVHLQQPETLCGQLRVDLGHLRRVFDNLFSNLRKYADPACPVSLQQSVRDGQLVTVISNTVLTRSAPVESNKIGLKTCEKLLSAMDGTFSQSRSGDVFTASFSLPLHEASGFDNP